MSSQCSTAVGFFSSASHANPDFFFSLLSEFEDRTNMDHTASHPMSAAALWVRIAGSNVGFFSKEEDGVILVVAEKQAERSSRPGRDAVDISQCRDLHKAHFWIQYLDLFKNRSAGELLVRFCELCLQNRAGISFAAPERSSLEEYALIIGRLTKDERKSVAAYAACPADRAGLAAVHAWMDMQKRLRAEIAADFCKTTKSLIEPVVLSWLVSGAVDTTENDVLALYQECLFGHPFYKDRLAAVTDCISELPSQLFVPQNEPRRKGWYFADVLIKNMLDRGFLSSSSKRALDQVPFFRQALARNKSPARCPDLLGKLSPIAKIAEFLSARDRASLREVNQLCRSVLPLKGQITVDAICVELECEVSITIDAADDVCGLKSLLFFALLSIKDIDEKNSCGLSTFVDRVEVTQDGEKLNDNTRLISCKGRTFLPVNLSCIYGVDPDESMPAIWEDELSSELRREYEDEALIQPNFDAFGDVDSDYPYGIASQSVQSCSICGVISANHSQCNDCVIDQINLSSMDDCQFPLILSSDSELNWSDNPLKKETDGNGRRERDNSSCSLNSDEIDSLLTVVPLPFRSKGHIEILSSLSLEDVASGCELLFDSFDENDCAALSDLACQIRNGAPWPMGRRGRPKTQNQRSNEALATFAH